MYSEVSANRELVECFEKKIQAAIGRVWGRKLGITNEELGIVAKTLLKRLTRHGRQQMKTDNAAQGKSYAFAVRVVRLYQHLSGKKKEYVL